jgi:hypothetical protein
MRGVGSLQTANHPWDQDTRKRQLFNLILIPERCEAFEMSDTLVICFGGCLSDYVPSKGFPKPK